MQRLLIVSGRPGRLSSQDIPGMSCTYVNPGACLSLLRRQAFDCVLVVLDTGGSPPGWLLEKIARAVADQGVPVVLGIERVTAPVQGLIEAATFTSLVDTQWEPAVLAACLRMAVRVEQPDQAVVQAQHDILSAVAHEAARLKELSVTDDLTGLYNRRYLDEVMAEERAGGGRFGRLYSVVVSDLDDLKKVNSRHGHATGSKVLNAVGRQMASSLRATDYGFRFGGDEFAFVLPNTSKPAAEIFADKIRRRIRDQSFDEVAAGLAVTLSMGIAACPDDGSDFAAVFVCADRALFEAKSAGKDRVALWRPWVADQAG